MADEEGGASPADPSSSGQVHQPLPWHISLSIQLTGPSAADKRLQAFLVTFTNPFC